MGARIGRERSCTPAFCIPSAFQSSVFKTGDARRYGRQAWAVREIRESPIRQCHGRVRAERTPGRAEINYYPAESTEVARGIWTAG